MCVNHKRIARIMRDDNLLAFRRERLLDFEDNGRGVKIYLNLPNRMEVSCPNQLWIADITYIEHYYNRCRLHSALGYRAPETFEYETAQGVRVKGPLLTFLDT
jgi:transposase InsO family protein